MRILLAEDDAALAQRLLPLLEQAGYVVHAVTDGREAEEIGQIEDLQAAIVDLGLPGLDGLSKPFQADELVLRLRALIRRSHGHASPRLHCGPLQLDVNAGRFELDGQALALSPQEFRLLSYFIHHSGQVIGRDRLGEQVFDCGHDPDSNALDVLLGRVRRKLGIDLIQTVRGQGWRLAAP